MNNGMHTPEIASHRTMARPSGRAAPLLHLPLEVLTEVCLHLDLHDLVRVAETCKRFRFSEDGLGTMLGVRQRAFAAAKSMCSSGPWVIFLGSLASMSS